MEHTPLGRLAQAVTLAPQLDLVVEYVDGGRETARLTADQLRAGVQLAPVVDDLATAELFSAASGLLNRPVARFWLQPTPSWAFEPRYGYTVDSFADRNAATSDEWPMVTLDNGQQLRLAAVQVSLEPDVVAGDVFWEVDPATVAPEHGAGAHRLCPPAG